MGKRKDQKLNLFVAFLDFAQKFSLLGHKKSVLKTNNNCCSFSVILAQHSTWN